MRILREPLETITASDIQQLCSDQPSEGTELELKSYLPSKAGKQADPWYAGKPFGEHARNQIADEIVAFANTLGGIVCIGIEESSDHPKRAVAPLPIPRAHELARRMRQSVHDIIDPPLPILEACGVELGTNGEGVVLLRVQPSRRRPHRNQANKEVFVRRADETVKVSMREIRELTLQAVSEDTKVAAIIADRRKIFRAQFHNWVEQFGPGWGCGLQLVGVPTTPLDLGRVVGRPRLINFPQGVVAEFGTDQHQCSWVFVPEHNWRPGLRSISATRERPDRLATYLLRTDGVCEVALNIRATDGQPGVFAGWLLGGMGYMLGWIERIRSEAGVNVEFALAVQLPALGRPIDLMRYGAHNVSDIDMGGRVPLGENEFPILSIGPRDEFNEHLKRFDEDIWNLAGQDFQLAPANFKFTEQR